MTDVCSRYNYGTVGVSHNIIAIIIVVQSYFVSPTCCWVSRAVDNYRGEEDMFDWLDDDEDDEADDLSPVQVDDVVSTGRMAAFFEKLNSLRHRRREDLLKSEDLRRLSGTDRKVPLSVEPSDESAAAEDYTSMEVSNRGVFEIRDRSAASVAKSAGDEATAVATNNSNYATQTTMKTVADGHSSMLDAGRPLVPQAAAAVGYLHLGWRSAKCLWRQYREAVTEQETLAVHERFKEFVRFWTLAVAVSVFALWSVFGLFDELFCFCVVAPPAEYAKDVNRYLTIVPPHVVVTNRGKMFRYQPTAEERILWESAKNIANFKI